jgi:hypothetical protein
VLAGALKCPNQLGRPPIQLGQGEVEFWIIR